MEIYGREGTLVVTGEESPQLGEVSLLGAQRGNTLAAMPVPERLSRVSAATPPGEPLNVGQMYALFAEAIRSGQNRQPTFATAVELHHLIDAISEASATGREVTVG